MRWYQPAGSVDYSQAFLFSCREFEQERSVGRRGEGGTLQYVRGNYKSSQRKNLTVVARRHLLQSPAWYSYYSRRCDVRREEEWKYILTTGKALMPVH